MVSVFAYSHPADYLRAVFEEKRVRNPAFSLRSFARAIGVPAASLSFVLAGKRGFSAKTLNGIARRLRLSPVEIEKLLSLQGVRASQAGDLLEQAERQRRVTRKFALSPESFAKHANWYSLVILEALELPRFADDHGRLANALGIPRKRLDGVIEGFLALGVLARDERGHLAKRGNHLLVSSDAPKSTLRAYHKQMLGKAIDAIRAETTHERYLGSEIVRFSKSDLPEAKKIIDRCLDDLIALAARAKAPDTVYQAGVQFFEMIPPEKKNA